MLKSLFFWCAAFSLPLFSAAEGELHLKQQAALNLVSFPDTREGVTDLLYLSIDELWHKGEYSDVFAVFRVITSVNPGDVEAWASGGWLLINGIAPLFKEERREEIVEYGIRFLKEGIEKNPDDSRLYRELAWFFFTRSLWDKSLEYLKKAEKGESDFKVGHLKAHVYMKKGMKREAIEEWEKVKELYPGSREVAERFIMQLRQEGE